MDFFYHYPGSIFCCPVSPANRPVNPVDHAVKEFVHPVHFLVVL